MSVMGMKDLRGRVRPLSRSQIAEAYWLSEDSVEAIAVQFQCTVAQIRALAGAAEVIGPPCPVCGQPFVAETRTEALDLVHAPATSADWEQGRVPVCCGPAVLWYYPLEKGDHASGEYGGGAIGQRWRELNAQWKARHLPFAEEADTDDKVRVRREEAKRVTCPACGAAPGEPCEGGRGARLSVHLERIALASRVKKVLRRRGITLR